MEKNRKRAQRRKDNARMLKRARKMVEGWYVYSSDLPSNKELHEIARIFRDNMQRCSCSGCGNPRRSKWYGKERVTMPERKAHDSYVDQLQEYYMTVDPDQKYK